MKTITQLPAGTWELDASSSTVTATVKKLGFITVAGTLDISHGAIEIDPEGTVTAVTVSLAAASYDSSNDKRDEHIRSEDFLGAPTHPSISFQSSTVKQRGGGYDASGVITIKGKQFPITLAVSDVAFDDARGSFSAEAEVNRKEIGLDKMPTFVIGQNLRLSISATAVRAA